MGSTRTCRVRQGAFCKRRFALVWTWPHCLYSPCAQEECAKEHLPETICACSSVTTCAAVIRPSCFPWMSRGRTRCQELATRKYVQSMRTFLERQGASVGDELRMLVRDDLRHAFSDPLSQEWQDGKLGVGNPPLTTWPLLALIACPPCVPALQPAVQSWTSLRSG